MQLEYINILDGVLDYKYYGIIKEVLLEAQNSGKKINFKTLRKTIYSHFENYPSDFDLWLFLDNHDIDRIRRLCDKKYKMVKKLIHFTESFNKPMTIYYGTEKKMMNDEFLSSTRAYDDENV